MKHPFLKVAVVVGCALTASASFAGEGAYVGVTVNGGVSAPIVPDIEFGAFAGYNFALSSGMVAGAEVDVAYNPTSLWGAQAITGKANARAGYELDDSVMAYAKAGAGYTTGGTGSAVWSVGAGVDVDVVNGALLRVEGERVDPLAAGMATQYNAKVGLGYSF